MLRRWLLEERTRLCHWATLLITLALRRMPSGSRKLLAVLPKGVIRRRSVVPCFGGVSNGIKFVAFDSHENVEVSGNDLLIQDISTGGEHNLFYISTTATDVVISDAHQKLTTSIAGATGDDSHTITVPLSSFTGNIIVRSAGGDDIIDITAPSRLVEIEAGNGLNRLIVNGSEEGEEFFVRESSTAAGSLEVDMPTETKRYPIHRASRWNSRTGIEYAWRCRHRSTSESIWSGNETRSILGEPWRWR